MMLRRVFECPSGFYAMGEDLTLEMWRAPGTASELRALTRAFREEAPLRKGRKFCTLAIMAMPPSTMLRVSEEERRVIMERIVEQAQHAYAGVTVIAMSGFSGAIVRGVLGALFHVRRMRTPSKVAAELDEALPILREMLAEHGKCAVSTAELRQAVEHAIPPSWTDLPRF